MMSEEWNMRCSRCTWASCTKNEKYLDVLLSVPTFCGICHFESVLPCCLIFFFGYLLMIYAMSIVTINIVYLHTSLID